jgi:hypothetical protein
MVGALSAPMAEASFHTVGDLFLPLGLGQEEAGRCAHLCCDKKVKKTKPNCCGFPHPHAC